MCLQISSIKPWREWNWSGDEIVHRPIIPASRTIPGTHQRYPIDIREFLTTTNNAVVAEKLKELIDRLSPDEQALFRSHRRGSFDFRADKVSGFLGELHYLRARNRAGRCPDAWLFPDETLAQGGGDCEDLAFLLAALLMAAGVSQYCIRVALGSLHIHLPRGRVQKHDHCWVMYQNEGGVWEILEPTVMVRAEAPAAGAAIGPRTTEYVPHYVFNTDHLWLIRSPQVDPRQAFDAYCVNRNFWNKFNPAFAAGVHSTIFDKALGGLAPAAALGQLKRVSLLLDANIFTYDPRDHFDTGYIPEGWALVAARLASFNANNADWDSFGKAGHSIADFYAHSSYLHFAQLQDAAADNGLAPIYAAGSSLVASPGYTATPVDPSLPPFDLTAAKFSVNPNLWKGTKTDAANQWAGKLITGRYAQKYDPKATFFEGFTSIPIALASAPDFAVRGSLPHHDEIAVDAGTPGSRHQLYNSTAAGPDDRQAYANQFRWRVNTAIAHLKQAFLANWHG